MAALIPLITFVYGIGLTSKVLAVCMLALPVIAMNSYKAVRNVSPSLVAMCHSFMGSRRQQIAKVILPAASPMMFAGIRLGVAEGFSGVVLAELLITPTGIGDLITYNRSVAKFAAHVRGDRFGRPLRRDRGVAPASVSRPILFRPETRSTAP